MKVLSISLVAAISSCTLATIAFGSNDVFCPAYVTCQISSAGTASNCQAAASSAAVWHNAHITTYGSTFVPTSSNKILFIDATVNGDAVSCRYVQDAHDATPSFVNINLSGNKLIADHRAANNHWDKFNVCEMQLSYLQPTQCPFQPH